MRSIPFVDYDLSQSNRVDAAFLNALWFAGYGVATLAALKALTPPDGPVTVNVKGYTTAGDGGGGDFWWDAASVVADNAATVIAPNSGGAGRWIRNYETLTAKMCGAVGDGVTDDVVALRRGCTIIGANSTFRLTEGNYLVTGEWGPSEHRVHIEGDGPYATQVTFAPTANGTCLKCDATGASVLYQGSIRGITFYSNDTTYVKTAIELVDTSSYALEDIVIGGSKLLPPPDDNTGFWGDTTNSSIGIRTRGREFTSFGNVSVSADKPHVISPQPNGGLQISADHFNYHNWHSLAAENPHITIEAGCVITQMSFTGYCGAVLGHGFLYWVDATSPGASNGLVINNLRYENAHDNTKYAVQINLVSGLQGFRHNGGQIGGINGWHLRAVQGVLDQTFFSLAGFEGINIDASVTSLKFINECFWQSGTTATIPATLQVVHKKPSAAGSVLPAEGDILLKPAGTYDEVFESSLGSATKTIAVGASLEVGANTQIGYFMLINKTSRKSAQFELQGAAAASVMHLGDAAVFSAVVGTASRMNVGHNGANRYVIQNNLATPQEILFLPIGSGQ